MSLCSHAQVPAAGTTVVGMHTMDFAFCSAAPLCAPVRTPCRATRRRAPPRLAANGSRSRPSSVAKRARGATACRVAAAAAAALLATGAVGDFVHPAPSQALGLAPTPINPYARRRAARAYEDYVQRLESRMEVLPLGDLKQVVSSGGGGPSVKYRIAGLAAFIASSISVLVVHPLDSVKTRLQAGASGNLLLGGLYKGVLGNLLKEAPNAAIYLGVYEIIKGALMSTALTPLFRDLPLLTFLLAGALGDAVGSVVRVPAEVVNKRLQLGLSDSFMGAMREIFGTASGRASLQSAWGSVLLRDVPFGGIQIMLYELGKSWLIAHMAALPHWLPTTGLPADIMVGSIVGAFTAFITTPADVLVTRIALASGGEGGLAKAGVMYHFRVLMRTQGPMGLFSGSVQRAAYYLVMSALFFGLYELTSHYASHPAQIVTAVHAAQHMAAAQLAAIAESVARGLGTAPSENWSAALYVMIEQLPVVMSFLSLQP